MSWTQGQQNRTNQSPFIDPSAESGNNNYQKGSGYSRQNNQRGDYNNTRSPQYTRTTTTNTGSREVAATFTQEGLQTFSTIFSSAVEAAIAKTLPDLVEKAVERKLKELLLLQREELTHVTQSLASDLLAQIQQSLPTLNATPAPATPEIPHTPAPMHADSPAAAVVAQLTTPEEEAAAEPMVSESAPVEPVAPKSSPARQTRTTRPTPTPRPASTHPSGAKPVHDVDAVIASLKQLNRPVKVDELPSLFPEIQWGRNPSVKMNQLIQKSNGSIVRVGRGQYQYAAV